MTMHLKCSGEARKRIDKLIDATRADYRANLPGSSLEGDMRRCDFGEAKSDLEQFIARLEQRVSQK